MLAPTEDTGLRFLRRILPEQGYYIAAVKDPRSKRFRPSEFASTLEGLWSLLQENDRNGFETYHACASFREPLNDPLGTAREDRRLGRTQHNVLGAKAFWLDIDVGPGKPYANQQQAFEALKTFCKKLALPIPIVVSSGAGLHIYWCLLQTLSPDDWGFYASGLKQLCVELDLKADPSRTTDISSILRTPGTHNRKHAGAPLVQCDPAFLDDAGPCAPQPLERFAIFAEHAPRVQGKKHSPTSLLFLPGSTAHPLGGNDARARVAQDLLSGIEDYPAVSGAEIANRCAQMRQMRDKHGVLPEPLWYALLGVLAFCRDGNELAHAWSSGDPRYSEVETSERLQRAGSLTGPTTCDKLHSLDPAICEACPSYKKITSPTALGRIPGQQSDPSTSSTASAAPASNELQWEKTQRGALKPRSYVNARKAIEELGIRCRHDIFHDKKIIEGDVAENFGPELADAACRAIRDLILARFRFDPGIENVQQAAERACEANRFDPVVDFFAFVRWDGQSRIDQLMTAYFGAEDTPLNRQIGRKMLIAAVRRARHPGCKFDYVVVLEGRQGSGKSTALKILAGEENFSDQPILHLDTRAQQEAIKGILIYEISELAGLRRTEVETVKSFLSKTHDNARPAYGRFRSDQGRRGIFVGTTNEGEYLRDATGNRRFLPITTGTIDLDALQRDRDQLWAEAAAAEARGEQLTIDAHLYAAAAEQQDQRLIKDVWEDLLANIQRGAVGHDGVERVSTETLLRIELGLTPDKINDGTTKRLRHAMQRLGWSGPKKMRFDERDHPGCEKRSTPKQGYWRKSTKM